MSGHIFFNDQWYGFDDAHYAAFRLLEILKKSKSSLDNLIKDLPKAFSTPEMNLDVEENKNFKLLKASSQKLILTMLTKLQIDGLRVNFEDGWGLLRASNTTPKLVLRFEANSQKRLNEIKICFLHNSKKIDESINIELAKIMSKDRKQIILQSSKAFRRKRCNQNHYCCSCFRKWYNRSSAL